MAELTRSELAEPPLTDALRKARARRGISYDELVRPLPASATPQDHLEYERRNQDRMALARQLMRDIWARRGVPDAPGASVLISVPIRP